MRYSIQEKIMKDNKLHDYLRNNTYLYRYLNRNEEYIEELIKKYKKEKREKNMIKANEFVDNIDMISNIINTI